MWTPAAEDEETTKAVQTMLARIQRDGESACLELARDLDGWTQPTALLTAEEIEEQTRDVPEDVKDDLKFQK